jgi:hypothetical protein
MNRLFLRYTLFFLGIIIIYSACLINTIPEKYSSFFKLTPEKQEVQFKDFLTEDQVNIHLIAVRQKHPGDWRFIKFLSQRCEKTVPELINRLSTEGKDSIKRDIMHTLVIISRGRCIIRDNSAYLNSIRQSLNKIPAVSKYKSLCEADYKRILGNQSSLKSG